MKRKIKQLSSVWSPEVDNQHFYLNLTLGYRLQNIPCLTKREKESLFRFK